MARSQTLHTFIPCQFCCDHSVLTIHFLLHCVSLKRFLPSHVFEAFQFTVLNPGNSLPLSHASTVQEPGQVPSVPLDLENAVRACPVCRVRSHYVTPSVVWFFSPEEKQEIVGGYKHKLK